MPWQWRSLLNSPNKSQDQDQYVDAQNSGSIRKVSILVQEQQASDPGKKKNLGVKVEDWQYLGHV